MRKTVKQWYCISVTALFDVFCVYSKLNPTITRNFFTEPLQIGSPRRRESMILPKATNLLSNILHKDPLARHQETSANLN
jgi:hypothetical protein